MLKMSGKDYHHLEVGSNLGQYTVERILGKGGMGQVYEVRHTVLETRHALKLINPQILEFEESLDYFRREAKVMAQLRHKGIVAVDDFGQTDGHYWLRCELISGIEINGKVTVALDDYLEERGELPHEREVYDFLQHTLDAIGYAHSKGVIHCDLKPANILLDPRGLKIADFGIVRLVREDWLMSEQELSEEDTQGQAFTTLCKSNPEVSGTFEYMSPEQKKGLRVGRKSDLYAIGLIAYQMLTGKEIPSLKRASELTPGIHGSWDRWLEKALEENPDDRFNNAQDMLTSLPRVRTPTGFKTSDRANPVFLNAEEAENHRKEGKKKEIRRSPILYVLGVLIVCVLVASGAWFISNLPDDNEIADQPEHENPPSPAPEPFPIPDPIPTPDPIPAPDPVNVDVNLPSTPLPPILEPAAPVPSPPVPVGPKAGSPHTLNLGIELVWVQAGKFLMGSPTNESQRFSNEGPQHEVSISKGFWMGKTEVTNEHWNKLLPESPRLGPQNMPVNTVSWTEASYFCQALNKNEGVLLPDYEARLPTEAEWEFACRAGSSHAFSFGPNSQNLGNHSWYGRNANGVPHPVGVQSSNRFGLHDMHGNLREWCQDRYSVQYPNTRQIDPLGPPSGELRVTRGGSWQRFEAYCRSAARMKERPLIRSRDLGFRIVVGPTLAQE